MNDLPMGSLLQQLFVRTTALTSMVDADFCGRRAKTRRESTALYTT